MNDRLKSAFGKVHAEEELKSRTRAFLYQKTNGYARAKPSYFRRLIPAAACFLFLVLGGSWLYFTPTVAISMDINPSIELGVNRFDKIVSVQGYNSDGELLANSLDIKYLDYTDAVNQVLENESVAGLLSDGEVITIGVIGEENEQSSAILAEIESCTTGNPNAYCYYANSDEVEKAHDIGLSYGKYRAYLELQSLGAGVTAEEVQNMTMREIRDLIGTLSGGTDIESPGKGSGQGNQGSGNGWGYGRGQANGSPKRYGNGEGS